MSASPPPVSEASSRQARDRFGRHHRLDRRSPAAAGDDRPYERQRSQRATWACERCRFKKLRCTGGRPCSACRRAEIECDFGDRALDQQQSACISSTNQRLSQLEKTLTELVSSLSYLTRPPLQPPSGPSQPSACPPSSAFPLQRLGLFSTTPADPTTTGLSHHVAAPELTMDVPDTERPSSLAARTMSAPDQSFVAGSGVSPLAQAQRATATSARALTSPSNSGVSEGLESRWTALQHSSAPFPALMGHPTVWSGKPAATSPEGDPTAESAVGMTHYQANVVLQSEPVSEGIINESVARALFILFFQKCHPLFPLLEPYKDLHSHFDHIRLSSPFLFSTILAVSGRYYTGYRETESATPSLPSISVGALEALADLACSHLGFVLFRKQHQLSDVQATLLLSVWIPRGGGQSADQWMITGLCTRLAYRIGLPESFNHPAILRLLNSTHLDADDVREVNNILPQFHTWLLIYQYDTSLSLGFGRPHAIPFTHACPRLYLTIVRKLGSIAQANLRAATYVASLAELSTIATDLISGLHTARLPPTPHRNATQPVATAWSNISALLSDLNPRLDEWQRQWTWSGSYDAIELGKYTNLVKIYGEHARLCLNSLSLNLITANAEAGTRQNHAAASYLARACEAAINLVQHYCEPSGTEPIVRYGGDYLVLILGQVAVFFVRLLVARFDQPLPIDQLVLAHHLKKAIDLLESNDLSRTGICEWVAQLSSDLARYAGLAFDTEAGPVDANMTVPDPGLPELEWDFDICAVLGQTIPTGETGLDLGHYFDFPQPLFPPSSGMGSS